MLVLSSTLVAIVIADLALKYLLWQTMRTAAVSLGPLGKIQLTDGSLWVRQARRHARASTLCALWLAAAVALVMVSNWIALAPVFIGLLLGGSLSNAMEHAGRGAISDYVCLRFWPAFNLADVAVALGAIGVVIDLVISLRALA